MDIRLVNLTKNFGSKYGNYCAVNNVNITLPSGKIVGLIGSGCGKSVLLQMISGDEETTSGQILIGERDIAYLPNEIREVGLVSLSNPLNPNLTVSKNIALPLEKSKRGSKLSKDEIMTRTLKYAKLLDVENYLERKASSLSGGQKVRVAIARELAKEPRLLLLDDPLLDLNYRLKLSLYEEIKIIQRKIGITTIFVSQDIEEIMGISDEIAIMRNGEIVQIGNSREVYTKPKNLFVANYLEKLSLCCFCGKVENKTIYIGEEAVGTTLNDLDDSEVLIGIRPEGFEISENGVLNIEVRSVSYKGRDTVIVGVNNCSENETFKFIIDGDINVEEGSIIKVNIKPHKLFIFDKGSEERLD